MASTLHGDLGGGVQRLGKVAGDPRARRGSVGVETGNLGWRQVEAATTGGRGDYDWSIAGPAPRDRQRAAERRVHADRGAGTVGLARENLSLDFTFRGETAAAGRPGPTSLVRADMDASEERTRLMSGVTLGLRRGNSLHEGRLVVSRTERRSLNPLDSQAVSLFPVDPRRAAARPAGLHARGRVPGRPAGGRAHLRVDVPGRRVPYADLRGAGAEVRAGRFGDPLAAPDDPLGDPRGRRGRGRRAGPRGVRPAAAQPRGVRRGPHAGVRQPDGHRGGAVRALRALPLSR